MDLDSYTIDYIHELEITMTQTTKRTNIVILLKCVVLRTLNSYFSCMTGDRLLLRFTRWEVSK